MFKLVLEKAEEPEIKLPTSAGCLNLSTPGIPVHHLQLEFTQTHVHQVADAIQSSHPLSSPSPPAKAREFQKDIYFCFIDYAKAFDDVDQNKQENSERGEYQTT